MDSPVDKAANEPIIEIKNLKKVFYSQEKETVALDTINLKIGRGEIYGVIGMSGAGKSTLVRCINSLEKPTEGSILIDGKDVFSLKGSELLELRRNVSMIFQQFNLLMQRTVIKNVEFPLEIAGWTKKKSREKAVEMLKLVGLEDKKDSYPSQLSGGQKQRVAIARALATNPKILLCDEATSALDPLTTNSILHLLKEINEKLGITIVVITHQMNVIKEICTHVAIIDNAKIVESGTVGKILTNPKTLIAKKLLGSVSDENGDFRCYDIDVSGCSDLYDFISQINDICKAPVDISACGSEEKKLLLKMPDNEKAIFRMCEYLKSQNIPFEEVSKVVEQ